MLRIIKFEQTLPIDQKQCWDFFSNPTNLDLITPPDMKFRIISELLPEIHTGFRIKYLIKPFPFYQVNWVTEIALSEAPERFIDVQQKGPFKIWEHTHEFIKIKGGMRILDTVQYDLGYGFIGFVIDKWIVYPRLRYIFRYRRLKLVSIFGSLKNKRGR